MSDLLDVPWWAWFVLIFEAQVYAFSLFLMWLLWPTIRSDLRSRLHPSADVEAPPVP